MTDSGASTVLPENGSSRSSGGGWSKVPAGMGGMVVLALWAAAWFVALVAHGGGSWHFFATGGHVLSDLDDGSQAGLHVYAEHPLLQIGPVALAAAWALGRLSDGHGLFAAQLTGAAMGLVVAALVHRIDAKLRFDRGETPRSLRDGRLLLAVACFAPVWLFAAVSSAHLDDILALTFSVAAVWLALEDRPVWAGLATGLAVDCKPWALPMVVVLLACPAVRGRATALGTALASVIAVWLPFFVADPGTSRALHYTIVNTPLSGLHLFDPGAARTPLWDRPVQTLVGAGLAGAALWRGRPGGALLLVMASRLALDPVSNRYYAAGLAAGALLWDMTGSRSRWPWWSLTVVFGLHFARWVPALDRLHGPGTVAFAAAAVLAVLTGPGPAHPAPRYSASCLRARRSSPRGARRPSGSWRSARERKESRRAWVPCTGASVVGSARARRGRWVVAGSSGSAVAVGATGARGRAPMNRKGVEPPAADRATLRR